MRKSFSASNDFEIVFCNQTFARSFSELQMLWDFKKNSPPECKQLYQ